VTTTSASAETDRDGRRPTGPVATYLTAAAVRLAMAGLHGYVDGLVHEPTQVHDGVVDLTVADVHHVTEPGRVDFGGGELDAAETTPLDTEHRDPDDDYGWWTLDHGTFLLEYNETIAPPEGERLVVQTRDAVLARGAYHPTLRLRDLDRVPVTVGDGIRLKENARVSTVVGRVEG